MNTLKSVGLLSALLLQVACHQKPDRPNIILMIGDGMGLSQITAAAYHTTSPLALERMEHIGLITTHSSRQKITDSAAGATAFSTGQKTYNGAIAMDDDTTHLPTILEQLKTVGYATGLIATSSITHATPACFYAHVPFRKMEEEIAAQLVKAEVDYIAGGGLRYFTARKDSLNLLNEFKDQAYKVVTDPSTPFSSESHHKHCYLLAEEGLPKAMEGRGNFLSKSLGAALTYFSEKQKPFFLVVEASQIDWGGHANDHQYVISELIDFDGAINSALAYAFKDGNTLVVVTADHETGGLSLSANGTDYSQIAYKFNTGGHTATMVPVFAQGVGSGTFSGVYDNTDIYDKMKEIVGLN